MGTGVVNHHKKNHKIGPYESCSKEWIIHQSDICKMPRNATEGMSRFQVKDFFKTCTHIRMTHMQTRTWQTLPDRRHKEGDMNIMPDNEVDRMCKGRMTERERETRDKIWDRPRWRLILQWAFTATDVPLTLTRHYPIKVEQDAQLLARCLWGSHNTKCKIAQIL